MLGRNCGELRAVWGRRWPGSRGRVPFVGIDAYLTAAVWKIKFEMEDAVGVSILVRAGADFRRNFLRISVNETANSAYQILVERR